MVDQTYMTNRKVGRSRPQGLLFANNPGTLTNGVYIPDGVEFEDFIILSDDNRSAIDISSERIENKQRMINGRMRSYFIAEKIKISTSWERLPSRGFADAPADSINENGTINSITRALREDYTTDGGAGGVEILNWYRNNPGSFWVYLAYDNYTNFSGSKSQFEKLGVYNEIVEVFFSEFSHSVEKRGATNYDFWNISLGLEEA